MQDIAKINANLLPYSIGVYFDADGEAAIRQVWADLAAADIADYMHLTGQRPHLTLGIYKHLDLDAAHAALAQISAETAPIPLSFQYLAVFPVSRSIFLGPVVTAPLLKLHKSVHEAVRPLAELPNFPYYLPEKWVPHCGLAIEVDADKVPAAIALSSQALRFTFDVTITKIGISTVPVENQFCCYPLGGT